MAGNSKEGRRAHGAQHAVVTALALILSACGGADAGTGTGSGGAGSKQLSGQVKIDGSSTVAPLTTAAAEFFAEGQPKVRVTVGTSGTGGGFEKFCKGEIDISDASRPIKDEEKAACEKSGIAYEELTIANDALTVVVNKDNDFVDCLTVDQLKKIWEPGSKVATWKDVDPSFPDEKLELYGPGTDSGTFDYFTDEINGAEGASRIDYSPSEDDNVLVQGVSGSRGGLGYFGFTYFEENQDKLKALQVDGGEGCVAPSAATVQDGTYKPLARPLFIYPSVRSLARPEALAFVEYLAGNDEDIARDAKYVPLNDEQRTKLKSGVEKLKDASGA